MNDRDFSIKDKKFKLNTLDLMKQHRIVRRMGPILGEIVVVASRIKNEINKCVTEDEKLALFTKLLPPIMDGIAKLDDASGDFVLLALCSAVEIHQPQSNNWARVSNGESFMFQNLTLPEAYQIAGRAFMFHLGDFFVIAPQTSHGGK